MFRISKDIIFSVMAHSILLAAVLLVGGSSEIRKASLITVLLSDDKESSSPGKQAAIADGKQRAQPMITIKPEVKPVTKLSKAQVIAPKQSIAPLTPVRPQSDSDRDPAPGLTGIETELASSYNGGSSPASVGSQTFRGSSGETEVGTSSASRGQTVDAGTEIFLKQRIRNALQANLIYPYIARKRGMEGTVHVEFLINAAGIPKDIRIIKGSGYQILDSAARETVLRTSPFAHKNGLIAVPITYQLTQQAQ